PACACRQRRSSPAPEAAEPDWHPCCSAPGGEGQTRRNRDAAARVSTWQTSLVCHLESYLADLGNPPPGALPVALIAGWYKRSISRRRKRTPVPHRADVGNDRAAPSNRRAATQHNSASVLPFFGSAALDLLVALVAGLAREPDDSPARDRLAVAPLRLVSDLGISIAWSLAWWAPQRLL